MKITKYYCSNKERCNYPDCFGVLGVKTLDFWGEHNYYNRFECKVINNNDWISLGVYPIKIEEDIFNIPDKLFNI